MRLLPGRFVTEGRVSWLLVFAGLGVFLGAADQTAVVAVFPQMVNGVGLPQDQFYRAAWIVNGYILGYIVAMPLMGRIADVFGHGRVFAAALLLFCVASVAVALAQNLTFLSIARAVQAVGGGAVVPVSMAMVTGYVSPARRALGLGAIAAASEAGGLIGPLWGGGIAELLGWRGVFWINVPLCLLIAYAIWRLSSDRARERRRIDFLGSALLGLSLTSLTIALTDDPIEPRTTLVTAGLFALAGLFLVLFLLRQIRAPEPVVDLGLFRRLHVSAAFLTNGLAGGALIVAMVNVPLFTNVILGGTALEGGLNLMRLTLALTTGALLGGMLANRFGLSIGAVAGVALAGAGFIGMSQWTTDPNVLEFTLPLLVAGLGFGLVIAPINTAVMDVADEDQRATLASLITVMRLIGALVGVALLTTRGLSGFYAEAGLVPLDDPSFLDRLHGLEVGSFHDTFLVTAAVCFIAVVPAALLGRRARRETDETL